MPNVLVGETWCNRENGLIVQVKEVRKRGRGYYVVAEAEDSAEGGRYRLKDWERQFEKIGYID